MLNKILIFIICFNSCLLDQFFIFPSKMLYATPLEKNQKPTVKINP